MDQQPSPSGLSSDIPEQFQQASQQVSNATHSYHSRGGRGFHRGRGGRGGRGQNSFQHASGPHHQSSFQQTNQQPHYARGSHQGQPAQMPPVPAPNAHRGFNASAASAVPQDFPPLGSGLPQRRRYPTPQMPNQPYADPGPDPTYHGRAQDLFQQNRASSYRGGQLALRNMNQNFGRSQFHSPQSLPGPGEFRRLQPIRGLYNPAGNFRTMHEQPNQDYRRMVMLQSDYLNDVAAEVTKNQLGVEELQTKEAFRKDLENIAQKAVCDCFETPISFDPKSVKLKCYGSLANGFGLPGCDMDLLLTFPKTEESIDEIEIASRRKLEKALLDLGFGARLLTNTRVPILKVCEKPSPELLSNLREYRAEWDEIEANNDFQDNALDVILQTTQDQAEAASKVFAELGDTAIDTALPPSPVKEHVNLEFKGDCGIQCDINFSNHVALHNTKLLRTYGDIDRRVAQMGIFVKAWAKTRGINTPYHGTLSSYGYVLMVLHYLMNVANPPVIPNLQYMARDDDAWQGKTEVALYEGFDVRFVSDTQKIAEAMQRQDTNRESLGCLLRGFFWYYSNHQGFHWMLEVISLRTRGGTLRKQEKGWTEAKRSVGNPNIRLRYLFCIEDPFEVEHNIARTVGHNGMVTIRDEFRRAWRIIERVERTELGWQWMDEDGMKHAVLMEVLDNRGDLLKKDSEAYKARMKKQREMEAKMKAAEVDGQAGEGDGNGMFDDSNSNTWPTRRTETSSQPDRSKTKLTHVGYPQDDRRMSSRRLRRVKSESGDERESEDVNKGDERSSSNAGKLKGECDQDQEDDFIAQKLSDAIHSANNPPPVYALHGLGAVPRPDPWDLSTEEGRWLEWRDNKIRNGTKPSVRSSKVELDRKHPYDPQRLPSDPTFGVWQRLEIYPPWPMKKPSPSAVNNAKGPVDEQASTYPAPPPAARVKPGVILWDGRTQGGRWLRWRDRQVSSGRFGEANTRNKPLSLAFPYDLEISPEELAAKNAILGKYYRLRDYVPRAVYKNEIIPRIQAAKSLASADETSLPKDEVAIVDKRNEVEDHEDKAQDVHPTKHDFSEKPDLEYLRARRLAFFAPRANKAQEEETMRNTTQPNNVQTLMKGAGIDVEARDLSRKDSGISLLSTKTSPRQKREQQRKTRPSWPENEVETPAIPEKILADPQPENEPEPELTDDNTNLLSSFSSAEVEVSVPTNLYPPNKDPEDCPRDEDPNIIPIPRKLAFQFDPRQLRDIAVIQDGGNGCVRKREGAGFEHEEDYELGGGGMMGWRASSSGVRHESCADRKEEWVKGTGDEEGLLGELPGL